MLACYILLCGGWGRNCKLLLWNRSLLRLDRVGANDDLLGQHDLQQYYLVGLSNDGSGST